MCFLGKRNKNYIMKIGDKVKYKSLLGKIGFGEITGEDKYYFCILENNGSVSHVEKTRVQKI